MVEKTHEELLQQPIDSECHPGDREDNLWLTLHDYQPPRTSMEWEQMCFLDKSFHGYYQWPKIFRYPLNRRERYTRENSAEQASILCDRFADKNFVAQAIQRMVADTEDGSGFDMVRFRLFKVSERTVSR
jgi:hypothetical protein